MNSSDDPASRSRSCPRCQHAIAPEMAFCVSCGMPLDRTPAPEHAAALRTSSTSGMLDATAVSCPKCGRLSPPEAKTCYCGHAFEEGLSQAREMDSDPPQTRGFAPELEERKVEEGEMEWRYAVGQEVRGPFSENEMVQKIQSGEIRGGTPVWNAEPPGWIAARTSPFAAHFATSPVRPVAGHRKASIPYCQIGWLLIGAGFVVATFYFLAYDISVRGDGDFSRVINAGKVADREAGLLYAFLLAFFGVASLFYDKQKG